MPYLAPLWTNRPVVCLVNHVHTELWRLRFPPPVAALGRLTESAVMPWVHRDNLFLTVSASTFAALREIGVDTDRIRLICNGVEPGPPPAPRSPEPLFLALGRLAEYKRIDVLLRLWDRVRHVTGGQLVIAGDGPERERLEAHGRARASSSPAGYRRKRSTGCCRPPGCCCIRPASRAGESWSPRPPSAARRRSGSASPGCGTRWSTTRPGLLVRTEGEFASAWASLAHRRPEAARDGAAPRASARCSCTGRRPSTASRWWPTRRWRGPGSPARPSARSGLPARPGPPARPARPDQPGQRGGRGRRARRR